MGVKGKMARSLILLFIMKADHFLTVCLWLNNSTDSTIFTFLSRLLVPVFLLNNVSRQGLPTNLWCLGITSISSYTFIYRINFFIKPSVFYYDKLCKIYKPTYNNYKRRRLFSFWNFSLRLAILYVTVYLVNITMNFNNK